MYSQEHGSVCGASKRISGEGQNLHSLVCFLKEAFQLKTKNTVAVFSVQERRLTKYQILDQTLPFPPWVEMPNSYYLEFILATTSFII